MPARPLILVVEDEQLISLHIEDALTRRGYALGGSFDTCREALVWLGTAEPDAAILDTQLKDGSCKNLAIELERRSIPFVVFSGNAADKAAHHLCEQQFGLKSRPRWTTS